MALFSLQAHRKLMLQLSISLQFFPAGFLILRYFIVIVAVKSMLTCFFYFVINSNIQSFSCYFKDLPAFELRTDNSCGKQPYFTRSRKTDEG